MSPLGRHRPPPPTEQEQQAAQRDLERIRQGGIPFGAEQRLKRLATASTPFFTSDLSAKEYALAEASGLHPVAQVMGSSVVHHGWIGTRSNLYVTGEIPGLSEPWNLARARAFDRLRQEAELAACDAVIGIELSTGSLPDPGNVELVVFGTAVRDRTRPAGGDGTVGTCTLTGQDVDKLRRIGAEVCGVVGHTTVLSVPLGMNSTWIMNSGMVFGGGRRMNVEIIEITQAVYDARARVMAEVRRQGHAVGANDIVISELRHTIEHHEYESNNTTYHYFHVTMHVLGTAIRLGARPPVPAPLTGPVMSINLGDQ